MRPPSLRGRVWLTHGLMLVVGVVIGRATWGKFRDGLTSLLSGCNYTNCVPYDTFDTAVWVAAMVLLPLSAGYLAWWTANRALTPLRAMAGVVRGLGPHNLGQRIRRGGRRDDLRALADAVDEMLDRMVVSFESQRRFASNASHELRTPLAVQRTLIEVAMVTGRGDPEIDRLGAQLLLVNERNERLIEGLLVLAESDRGLPSTVPVRLDQLVTEVVGGYEKSAAEHGVELRRSVTPRTVSGDPVLLERLVGNLVHNAIKYNEPGGRVEIVVGEMLSVRNTGQVVPANEVSSLFEPFRRLTAERTRQRDGAGLGLSIVRSIVAAHHGTVSARPGEQGGLWVDVTLPSAPRAGG
ncbi:sensor histidine kinase [Actinokineospora enzanensis]|uniref:sensor histidine kinase n=1 Tax=Actinokineospora enzanensis TaxID=155975 RepID=UPI000370E3AF|nr:ATP-binding protein [Actinokineospora enzanensis]